MLAVSAQEIRGVVVDGQTREPVPGAMVVVLDDEGRTVGRGLAGADGSYRIRFRMTGADRLRIDRIGYASTHTPRIDVRAGEIVELYGHHDGQSRDTGTARRAG